MGDTMSRSFVAASAVFAALLTFASGGEARSDTSASDVDALHAIPQQRCDVGAVQPALDVPGLYEAIAAAPNGDVFVSDQATLDVLRITPAGEVAVVTRLYEPPNHTGDDVGTFGMTFAHDGALWIASYDFLDGTHHGLYRVARDGSAELAVPMNVADALFPNGIVFDDRGNLYVTESIAGVVWRVARGERVARRWLEHELLAPLPPGTAFGFGANGIAYNKGALYVANSDRGSIVKIPIDPRGDPGTPTVFADGLFSPDAVTLGPGKDVYVSDAFTGRLIRIADDGTWEVAALTGFQEPANTGMVFGAGIDRFTAYVTNFGFAVPGVVKVNLCQTR